MSHRYMNSAHKSDVEPFVTVDTVARLLGVPRSFVYEKAAAGELPCYRAGRYLRFRVSEVERWLRSSREEQP